MELFKSIILILVSISFAIGGQFCLKTGMNSVGGISVDTSTNYLDIARIVFSKPMIWIGLVQYGVGSLFWMIVLSRVNLSFAYPMLAISYIIIMLISIFHFHEHVSMVRWIGAVFICIGVIFITRS